MPTEIPSVKSQFKLALAAAVLNSLAVHAVPSPDTRVLGADERIDKEPQAAWTVKWWQWEASFNYRDSPVGDTTGARCMAGQSGDVWFLAGTYEAMATHRTCRVPAEKTLFFPLINYVATPHAMDETLTCEQAKEFARQMTDEAIGLFVELDGRRISNLDSHRIASAQCFDLAARTRGTPKVEPSASDGYWVALHPLAKGRHTLRFGGSLPSLRQELVYTLIVE